MRFAFRFSTPYRILGAPFGITPSTTMVEVAEGRLTARFGPWLLDTPLSNIEGVCETGPYDLLKTAGPAHLSLADRGLTMATTQEGGVCIRFNEPVRGIDPLGWIRHPGLTVTVDRIDELRRAIRDNNDADDGSSPGANVPGRSPWSSVALLARWPVGMALATTRYLAAVRNVEHSIETRATPPPDASALGDDEANDVQQIDDGVGPAYERVYRTVITGSGLRPAQLFERLASDLNRVLPTEVAELLSMGNDHAIGQAGQQFTIRTPGPWEAGVRVVERTPTSLRLATLEGHMEAGEIEFNVAAEMGDVVSDSIVFEIRSVARSGDRAFDLLYRVLSLGRRMQEYVWVHTCERVAAVAEGERLGPITVHTIRYAR